MRNYQVEGALVYEKVAGGRLDLRVERDTHENLERLVREVLSKRPQHVVAIFDESTISVRRRRVERLLPMSPFCVRNEIVVDRMLGDISLSPHPGEPPFSDFVMMIHEFEQEQRDSTMIASADADRLRSTIDGLLLGDRPPAHWVLLADRALPAESGMNSIRLPQRKEGDRQVLLCAADYGRLATLMSAAFSNCNLTIAKEGLGDILRQGVNLVGAGLLDMIKKQSGVPDNPSVLGFVGMLLAARQVRSEDTDALVASVDGRIARLWLKLGQAGPGKRCDLIAVRRRAGPGQFMRPESGPSKDQCWNRTRVARSRLQRKRQTARHQRLNPSSSSSLIPLVLVLVIRILLWLFGPIASCWPRRPLSASLPATAATH